MRRFAASVLLPVAFGCSSAQESLAPGAADEDEQSATVANDVEFCWSTVANLPGCRVFSDDVVSGCDLQWQFEGEGDCPDGKLDGMGTLTAGGFRLRSRFVGGLPHGPVLAVAGNGHNVSGSHVHGKKDGRWIVKEPTPMYAYEGWYSNGKRVGEWVETSGTGAYRSTSRGGYVDDVMQGRWIVAESIGHGMVHFGEGDTWTGRNTGRGCSGSTPKTGPPVSVACSSTAASTGYGSMKNTVWSGSGRSI